MSTRSDIALRLGAAPLFARCNKGDLRIVARHAERVALPEGSVVVCQGEPGNAFYLLLTGTARVERDGVLVTRLGPGDCFGELALLDPAPRAATVTLESPGELAVLGARMFSVLLRELPALSGAMLAALARRARDGGAVHIE